MLLVDLRMSYKTLNYAKIGLESKTKSLPLLLTLMVSLPFKLVSSESRSFMKFVKLRQDNN